MSTAVHVVCATSLDGKISTADRLPWRWSDPEDHDWLLSRMAAADLLVVGAGTVRAEDPTLVVPDAWAERRGAQGRPPQPVRLILTPSLSVSPECRAVKVEGVPLLIAAERRAIEESGDAFRDRAILIPWSDDLALRPVLEEARGFTEGDRVVCLGGGRTNAAFLEQDLVERISLTISSFVIGAAGAPGPFDGRGFPPAGFPQFRLERSSPAGRDLILEYARDRGGSGRDPSGGLD